MVNLGDSNFSYSEGQIQLSQSIVDATASTLSNLLYMEKQEVIIEERTSRNTFKNKELERVITELQQLSREKIDSKFCRRRIFGLDLDGNITFVTQLVPPC